VYIQVLANWIQNEVLLTKRKGEGREWKGEEEKGRKRKRQ
jgi:hypothetical protein